jgi:hypothetical protein
MWNYVIAHIDKCDLYRICTDESISSWRFEITRSGQSALSFQGVQGLRINEQAEDSQPTIEAVESKDEAIDPSQSPDVVPEIVNVDAIEATQVDATDFSQIQPTNLDSAFATVSAEAETQEYEDEQTLPYDPSGCRHRDTDLIIYIEILNPS